MSLASFPVNIWDVSKAYLVRPIATPYGKHWVVVEVLGEEVSNHSAAVLDFDPFVWTRGVRHSLSVDLETPPTISANHYT